MKKKEAKKKQTKFCLNCNEAKQDVRSRLVPFISNLQKQAIFFTKRLLCKECQRQIAEEVAVITA